MALPKPDDAEPKTSVQKTEATPVKPVETTKKQISPLWWVFGTLLAVVMLLFILGAVKQAMFAFSDVTRSDDIRGGHMMNRSFDRQGLRGGMMDDDSIGTTRVSGVVTAIDGDTITVAGNGATKQVKTTDTTEYFGAAQPVKVNDSVRISGTTSGDTFTATQVLISRQ